MPVDWRATADDDLLQTLLAMSEPGDVILIKGSNRVFWQQAFANRFMDELRREQ